ncbi:MAG: sulfite exporter TauE/SafE family protein [Calditrichaceae bacterium]|nr:sulfite exporter TauE/SafE family protein [Calditrichaceae bacterium]MBN2710605.1 sulfite exporter TauE/SafE family protein [Calditrichaceae bacterium]
MFTIPQIAAAIIIAAMGALVQSAVGFGLGPLSVPLLLLVDPAFVPGPVLMNGLVLTIFMFKREINDVDYFGLKWATIGRFMGTIIGAALLYIMPKESLKLYFGVAILIAVSFSWMGFSLPFKKSTLVSAGIISGFMGTTVSIGGPPMALVYQNMSGPKIRSTLSGIFGIGTIMGVISLTVIGYFGQKEIYASIILLPGLLSGFALSKHTFTWLDKGFLKPAILVLSSFAALIVIVSYFSG